MYKFNVATPSEEGVHVDCPNAGIIRLFLVWALTYVRSSEWHFVVYTHRLCSAPFIRKRSSVGIEGFTSPEVISRLPSFAFFGTHHFDRRNESSGP